MNADQLRNVIQNGNYDGGEDARERTVASARGTLIAGGTARRNRRRQFALAGATAVACLALVAITPPGQAATNWVSSLISGPNTFEPGDYGYQLQTSTLIGSGEMPTGDRYQVRGYVNSNGATVGCAAIVWENSNSSLPECSNVSPPWGSDRVSMPVAGRLPNDDASPGSRGIVVIGAAPSQSSEVQIRVPNSDGVAASDESAQLFPIDGKITDTDGASVDVPPVQVFVGYLPPGAGDFRSAPPAQAVAFDGNKELGSVPLSWINFHLPSDVPHIMACVQGDPTCQHIVDQEAGMSTPSN
jgi:hypothetical protein